MASQRESRYTGLAFSRPLVLIQSDDWGRVGVRDREGHEQLRANGIRLGENPYDFYTLETTEDVIATSDLLKRHRDRTGWPACLGMNFILANLNFPKMAEGEFRELHLLLLTRGLPGSLETTGAISGIPAGHRRWSFLFRAAWVDAFLPSRGGTCAG
jgi:hypothetical protein